MRRAPKKSNVIPITGLSLFAAEKKTSIEADWPDLTKLEVFTMINQRWDELDNETKLQYERKADYARRTETRRISLTKRKDDSVENASMITPYSVFLRTRHHELKKSNPGMTVTQRAEQIKSEWSSMSREQKISFINMAKRETRKFRRTSMDDDPPP
jgi:hypothetical protein